MKHLRLTFLAILVAMVTITARASFDQSVVEAGRELWPHWWFRATLADAYFGFLTVYSWVWYRETSAWARTAWGVSFVVLGNIAIAVYVLRAIIKLPPDARFERLLLRDE